MKARISRGLDQLSVLLGLGVIVLVGLNFTLRHDLATGSRIRFLVSGGLLALVALYFRLDLRRLDDLRRAAYRVATTLMLWSLGYALFPYPQTFLYLLILPALFFLFRLEVKARAGRERQEDLVASGLLFALGALLYFEQQPMQVILFSDADFDWLDYYRSAPVMAVVGLGFLRLAKRGGWAGLSILGTVFVLLSLVLTSSLLTPVDGLFGVPIEICYVLVFIHLCLALLFVEHRFVAPLAGRVYDFAGLSGDERRRFRLQVYWLGNAALHLTVPVILMASWGQGLTRPPSGEPSALVLALAAVVGSLYHYRRTTVSLVLVEISLLAFPICPIFYPGILATVLCVVLGLVLATIVLLRRSYRFAGSGAALPNPVYVVCSLIFLASLVYRGFFVPSNLGFLLFLLLSWMALPERPEAVPPRFYHWIWPPLTALLLLCLFRGYDPFLLPIWALSVIAPPIVAYAFLTRVDVVQRYGWIGVTSWLTNAPRALSTLAFVAVLICGAGFALDYGRYVERWDTVLLVFAVLTFNLGFHLTEAIRSSSTRYAAIAEVHLWMILGLLRFKLEVMETLELGTPVDGYVFLAAAFLVAGLREVLRRPGVLGGRADVFSLFLLRSMTVYAVIGWLYMLWLELYYGGGYHGETGSMLMAALYYWFSLSRKKTYIIPAIVLVNVAAVLFFFRVGFHHPQFYVLPTAASVLILAQILKEELPPRRLAAIRLGCSLAVLGTSSFYNLVSFAESLLYPLVAALVAALGVVVGISLRVRVFLFLGFSFFVLNTLTVLVHVILNQPPSHVKLAMGVVFLVLGVVFTGSFLLLQMKRQELIRQYARWKEELSTWE